MNEPYWQYSQAIRNELESIRDKESEQPKPEKKGLYFWQKLRIPITLLLKKASK